MTEPEIVEDFYGVYLLYNINPKYKGRTYIGYTRDPNRRIMQHNRGTWAGGAHRTNNRGPWKMVMIVHGFPNNISALRFEWAWQNPNKTTRLQHLGLKKIPRKETEYQFKLRVLSEMLRVGPWCRLPLLIRWLENEYREEFPHDRKPPAHMLIIQGPVKSYNRKKVEETNSKPLSECLLCSGYLKDTEKLNCMNVNCNLVSHISCLANLFLTPGEYIPISGFCPFCNTNLKWGDLIRRMNGYDQGVKDSCDGDVDDEEVCTQDRDFENLDKCDEIMYTQDRSDDFENNEVGIKNREFVDDFDDGDDIVCTQDAQDIVLIDDNFENIEKLIAKNRQFIDNFDYVDCTKDKLINNLKTRDDLKTTTFVGTFDDGDDVICVQDKSLVDNLNNCKYDDIVCTQDKNGIVNKNDDSSDSDNEIIFKCNKVYDDQPSWFLDCNENL